ncbi:MAG: hypothetical protein EOO38_14225 [Cytophagaceae bacterium]|nr:MAG: hypothetical protein EOO38_14225 [Cytophagaceae bacterium]
MIIIHKGRKITEGVVQELLDPSHTIVDLQTTDDKHTLGLLQHSPWSGNVQQDAAGIRLQMNRNDIAAMSGWLAQNGTGIIALNPKNSLEDYFLSLTNQATHVESVSN